MNYFATFLAAAIGVAQLATGFRIERSRLILAASAKKDFPSDSRWISHHSWRPQPGIHLDWDSDRRYRAPMAPQQPLHRHRWSDVFASEIRWKLPMEDADQVSDTSPAEAELDLAEASLRKALAAGEAGGALVKAGEALALARAAIHNDGHAGMAGEALDNVEVLFSSLLGAYARRVMAGGKAEAQNAQHVHAALHAATEAVSNARMLWRSTRQKKQQALEELKEQSATEAQLAAGVAEDTAAAEATKEEGQRPGNPWDFLSIFRWWTPTEKRSLESLASAAKVSQANAAKAKLDLAMAAVREAWVVSGASEQSMLDKAGGALAVARAAMGDDKRNTNDELHEADTAMSDAQYAFDRLLGIYAMTVLADARADTRNAQRAHAAIFAAAEAVATARDIWNGWDPWAAANHTEATESVAQAVARATNAQLYGDSTSGFEENGGEKW